jgi:hypothetical protein
MKSAHSGDGITEQEKCHEKGGEGAVEIFHIQAMRII